MDLSIIIPSRNEQFLARTVQDILENIEADTEITVVLDGQWADPPVPQHERVNVIYIPETIGQRAAANIACKLSKAKFVMKVDAHCLFDKGFDRKMIAEMKEDWTAVPIMKNLHAFDWVCPNGHRRYQSPSGICKQCGQPTKKEIIWKAKPNTRNYSYCFDSQPHFQYFKEFNRRPEGQGDITETMSLQGSCFMLTREKWWELNICDESLGNWGNQGIEVAVKTWLSGGKVMVIHNTWYAHMFRTQGGDFGFPYKLSGNEVQQTKNNVRDLLFTGKWDKAKYPISWLIRKFMPVADWNEEKIKQLDGNR
jgi:glycosyltransferase involved in cell wall biosynthesis